MITNTIVIILYINRTGIYITRFIQKKNTSVIVANILSSGLNEFL